jgi:hypothetical protein
METSQPLPVVVCADSFRALYPGVRFTTALKAVALCGPFFLLGEYFKIVWPGVIGVCLVGGVFVVPHILRVRSFLSSLPCASCGRAAGGTTTVNLILHLKCRHCGHLSRTDCLMSGSMPTKV